MPVLLSDLPPQIQRLYAIDLTVAELDTLLRLKVDVNLVVLAPNSSQDDDEAESRLLSPLKIALSCQERWDHLARLLAAGALPYGWTDAEWRSLLRPNVDLSDFSESQLAITLQIVEAAATIDSSPASDFSDLTRLALMTCDRNLWQALERLPWLPRLDCPALTLIEDWPRIFEPISQDRKDKSLLFLDYLLGQDPKALHRRVRDDEDTLLTRAIRNNLQQVVRHLLQRGADPHQTVSDKFARANIIGEDWPLEIEDKVYWVDAGVTPLHRAAQCNRPDICQMLLDHGADPERRSDSPHSLYTMDDFFEDDRLSLPLTTNPPLSTLDVAILVGARESQHVLEKAVLDRHRQSTVVITPSSAARPRI